MGDAQVRVVEGCVSLQELRDFMINVSRDYKESQFAHSTDPHHMAHAAGFSSAWQKMATHIDRLGSMSTGNEGAGPQLVEENERLRRLVAELQHGRDERFTELEASFHKTFQLYTQAMTEKAQLRNHLDDVRRALKASEDL